MRSNSQLLKPVTANLQNIRKICHNNKYSGVIHRDFVRNQNQVSMRNEPLEKIKLKSETANLQKSN